MNGVIVLVALFWLWLGLQWHRYYRTECDRRRLERIFHKSVRH
jgi:hypothetical protein